jgi:hypothetical protein
MAIGPGWERRHPETVAMAPANQHSGKAKVQRARRKGQRGRRMHHPEEASILLAGRRLMHFASRI